MGRGTGGMGAGTGIVVVQARERIQINACLVLVDRQTSAFWSHVVLTDSTDSIIFLFMFFAHGSHA